MGNRPFPFAFPPAPGYTHPPVWNGRGFDLGDQKTPILSYEVGKSGWTDELTTFHEDTAGDDHYIDRASRLHTLDQLRRWLTVKSPTIIDIGCSSGVILGLLCDEFSDGLILGADYVRGPLESLAQKLTGVPLFQFDLTSCPLPDQSVDGIVLLNVLEHIERDEAALFHVARILKPGGIVVIEVPAGPQLYDVYDKLLFHHRRYSMRELTDKVSRQGLKVLDKSHLGFFLYPAFWVTKMRGKRYLKQPEAIQRTVVTRNITTASSQPVMHRLMEFEASLRKSFYYPAGIRCLVTCQRAG
jgi:ubiquinone/menaquinone biosynthesis C-methylase UbiE